MLLLPGQYSEPWQINKYGGLGKGKITLPGEPFTSDADWSCLKPSASIGFPRVLGCYNLWILLEEARLIQEHLISGDYENWYPTHLDNTLYRPLIKKIIEMGKK